MSGFALGLAPDLALAGFTAQEDAIEEALGNLVGDGFNPAGLLEASAHAGRSRATGCACAPAAIRSMRRSTRSRRPWPRSMPRPNRSSASTSRPSASLVMRHPDPPTSSPRNTRCRTWRRDVVVRAARASTRSTIRRSTTRPTWRCVTGADRRRPALKRLRAGPQPARVTLTRRTDGRHGACDSPRGDVSILRPCRIRRKFRVLAGRALTAEGLDQRSNAR